jgi:hypothetical protein
MGYHQDTEQNWQTQVPIHSSQGNIELEMDDNCQFLRNETLSDTADREILINDLNKENAKLSAQITQLEENLE